MSIFINDIGGYVGRALTKAFGEGLPIVGSITAGNKAPAGGHIKTVPREDSAAVKAAILEADIVAFSAMGALPEAMAALKCLRKATDEKKRTFVCITSTMCWARTKATAEMLQESNYRKRKPSVKFQDMKNFETIALDSTTDKLQTVIIGAGVVYGMGEDSLETILRDAWLNSDTMVGIPALDGRGGKNIIPMIHVADVAAIATWSATTDFNDGDDSSPKGKYLLAIDNGRNTLADIVQAVSDVLAVGETRVLTEFEIQELALEKPEVCQILQMDLEFDLSTSYVQSKKFELQYAEGFVENIGKIAKEFKQCRELTPVRCVLMGPPAVGKTTYATRLAEHYAVPLISQQLIIQELAASTSDLASDFKSIIAAMEKGGKKAPKAIPPEMLAKAFRWKLTQNICLNHGWILDDFPDTFEGAEALFSNGKVQPSDENDANGDDVDESELPYALVEELKPTGVVCLDASDNFLMQRFLELSEEDAAKYNDQNSFKKLLDKYKKANAEDKTDVARNFFESSCDIEALCFRLETDEDNLIDDDKTTAKNIDAIKMYLEKGSGKPFNFRPTFYERRLQERKRAKEEQAERERKRAAEEAEAKRKAQEREQNELEEKRRLDEVARQEMELLEARAMPLRNYLMENVIPTLTKGLLEVCKAQPEDPVDYLAEWLFKNNPEDS